MLVRRRAELSFGGGWDAVHCLGQDDRTWAAATRKFQAAQEVALSSRSPSGMGVAMAKESGRVDLHFSPSASWPPPYAQGNKSAALARTLAVNRAQLDALLTEHDGAAGDGGGEVAAVGRYGYTCPYLLTYTSMEVAALQLCTILGFLFLLSRWSPMRFTNAQCRRRR